MNLNEPTSARGELSGTRLSPDEAGGDAREILRKLEITVTRRLDGLLHGDHRGLVPGHGSELGETRRYAAGDDVRRIDWNVSARLREPHIRQTIADRELETWLVLDRSARLNFGTKSMEKRDLVLAAAAAIGFLTQRSGNRIGAILVGGQENAAQIIRPRGSRKHLLHILHTLAESHVSDGTGVTELGDALHKLGALAKRRGLVVVASDFRVAPGWQEPMKVLARRQDVIAAEVSDPRESELPNVGLITVQDPATGAVREVATNKAKVRDAYALVAKNRMDDLEVFFRSNRMDHLQLRTDTDWIDEMVRFVSSRQSRIESLTRNGGGR